MLPGSAEQPAAADAFQRPLRSRFQARLSRSVKAQPELPSFVDISTVADTVNDDGLLVFQDFKDDSV